MPGTTHPLLRVRIGEGDLYWNMADDIKPVTCPRCGRLLILYLVRERKIEERERFGPKAIFLHYTRSVSCRLQRTSFPLKIVTYGPADLEMQIAEVLERSPLTARRGWRTSPTPNLFSPVLYSDNLFIQIVLH